MEQVPGMLWLAAVMGLLAACAFSFLFYLAFRRPRATDAYEDESLRDEALADDTANLAGTGHAGLPATSAAEQHVDATPDDDLDPAMTVLSDEDEDESWDSAELCPSTPDDLHRPDVDADVDADADDAAVLSAALATLEAAELDGPAPPASVEGDADWFATRDDTPEFDDFDPEEDDLVVVWDDATGPEPSVLVKRSDEDPALTQVLMGDVIVAQVRTKANVDHEHVSLMPLSLARSLGWAHA